MDTDQSLSLWDMSPITKEITQTFSGMFRCFLSEYQPPDVWTFNTLTEVGDIFSETTLHSQDIAGSFPASADCTALCSGCKERVELCSMSVPLMGTHDSVEHPLYTCTHVSHMMCSCIYHMMYSWELVLLLKLFTYYYNYTVWCSVWIMIFIVSVVLAYYAYMWNLNYH